MDTPVIILDEPTAGQDEAGLARLAHLLQVLKARGKTVVAITHDMDFCAAHFDRLILMAAGRILLDGAAVDVLARTNLLRVAGLVQPQVMRLGRMLWPGAVVRSSAEFLTRLQQAAGRMNPEEEIV